MAANRGNSLEMQKQMNEVNLNRNPACKNIPASESTRHVKLEIDKTLFETAEQKAIQKMLLSIKRKEVRQEKIRA